jgi:hypothetical protein
MSLCLSESLFLSVGVSLSVCLSLYLSISLSIVSLPTPLQISYLDMEEVSSCKMLALPELGEGEDGTRNDPDIV